MRLLNLGLGRAANRALSAWIAENPRDAYRTVLVNNEDGSVCLKGAIDSAGFTVKTTYAPDGTVTRKGYRSSGRTIDPLAAAHGFTQADVAAVRAILRRAGVRKTTEETFALLCEAQYLADNRCARYAASMDSRRKYPNRAEYIRAKRARRIARLRDMGVCIMCGREYVDPGRSTCPPCGARANARKRSA